MADFGTNPYGFKDAVTIEAERIFDSCSDRDCLEDLEVTFSDYESTQLVNEATYAKAKCVEVTSVYFQVEPIPFNCGFFSVDLTYTFAVTIELAANAAAPVQTVVGTACFTKKVILYGSDGGTKYFTSFNNGVVNVNGCNAGSTASLPKASVAVADPILLNLCLQCVPAYSACTDITCNESITIPSRKIICVTIGLFSIISLSRTVPVMVPAFNYEVPCKDCSSPSGTTETPCELFEKIRFPSNEFFPKSLEEATACSCTCAGIANAVASGQTSGNSGQGCPTNNCKTCQ